MYSETLAHQIYAAADMLLVPSLFEPCGLTQVGGWVGGRPGCRLTRERARGWCAVWRGVELHSIGRVSLVCLLDVTSEHWRQPRRTCLASHSRRADDCAEVRHRPCGALHRLPGRHSEGCGQPPGAMSFFPSFLFSPFPAFLLMLLLFLSLCVGWELWRHCGAGTC
jgi:hypothetical protein